MSGDATVLVDTGPLVALFDPSDRLHEETGERLDAVEGKRLVTSLAVLTEASYLLAYSERARQALFRFVAVEIEIEAFGVDEVRRAAELMAKWSDLPMDFADATLVVLGEKLGTTSVLTFDRRDFGVYRIGRRRFRLV